MVLLAQQQQLMVVVRPGWLQDHQHLRWQLVQPQGPSGCLTAVLRVELAAWLACWPRHTADDPLCCPTACCRTLLLLLHLLWLLVLELCLQLEAAALLLLGFVEKDTL
jgi:hypothetical protein